MTDSRATEAATALDARCGGEVIEKVLVHGINSLKTVDPPLSALAGAPLVGAEASGEACVEITASSFVLIIDLQRTGRVRFDDMGFEWSPGAPGMPTIQVVFEGGLVANFIEPGKTKRITLRATSV